MESLSPQKRKSIVAVNATRKLQFAGHGSRRVAGMKIISTSARIPNVSISGGSMVLTHNVGQ